MEWHFQNNWVSNEGVKIFIEGIDIIIHLLYFHYYAFLVTIVLTFYLSIFCYKVNPKLSLIWGKPFHYFDILIEIYDKYIATRAQAESAREKVVWSWLHWVYYKA